MFLLRSADDVHGAGFGVSGSLSMEALGKLGSAVGTSFYLGGSSTIIISFDTDKNLLT